MLSAYPFFLPDQILVSLLSEIWRIIIWFYVIGIITANLTINTFFFLTYDLEMNRADIACLFTKYSLGGFLLLYHKMQSELCLKKVIFFPV